MKLRKWFFITILALGFILAAENTQAQCPMCRMAVESNLKGGGSAGKGLNTGILYMLATPYVLIGGLAYVWWRNRRKPEEEEQEQAIQELMEE
jgi:hypothetical protein